MSEYNIKDHAEWRPTLYKGFGGWWLKCTSCGYITRTHNEKEYKYCPNCGAKMDGEKK